MSQQVHLDEGILNSLLLERTLVLTEDIKAHTFPYNLALKGVNIVQIVVE